MFQFFLAPFHKFKLGQRLTLYVSLVCGIFMLFTLAILLTIQYYLDYTSLQDKTFASINTIEEPLAISLWQVDQDRVQLILEGANNLPHISGLKIEDPVNGEILLGTMNEEIINRPLVYENQIVGHLSVSINLQVLYEQFLELAATLILGMIVIFGLIIFVLNTTLKKVVIEHLKIITSVASSEDYLNPRTYTPIKINRPNIHDEISELVKILNQSQRISCDHEEERKLYQEELQKQANHDVLTCLPNRHHANGFIKEAVNALSYASQKLAILFIDLDGFKEVNDTLGHNVGDWILEQTASRFRKIIRNKEIYIARFGGDEFIAVFSCRHDDYATQIAGDLSNEIKLPFHFEGQEIDLSCSIGIVYSQNHEQSASLLIRQADIAMYAAKEAGRNRYAVFVPEMAEKIVQTTTIKAKLQHALENDLFTVYYQPLVNILSQETIGFEALIRWFDEDGTFIPPDVFIPIAEKTGLAFELDKWVFSKAAKQVQQWRENTGKDFDIAINFSPCNFVHKDLQHWLDTNELFKEHLNWVEIEVTERLMLNDDDLVTKNLEKLLSKGMKLSIDDFGTGYSSLGYIQQFSRFISKIKIDRMFVNEINHDEASQALVKTIITMAHNLSLEVLAEGIETEEQSKMLAELGCQLAQGYYYDRPQPASDIEASIYNGKIIGREANTLFRRV